MSELTTKRETSPRANGGEPRRIQSINVGFQLIRHLAASPAAMAPKELAQATGMAPSQVHMYMASFILEGLVVQDPVTARYHLGPYALDLGLASLRKLDILQLAKPTMLTLRDRVGRSVFLTVWGNYGATMVAKVDGHQRSAHVLRIGYVLPTMDTATGRVYLAYLSDEDAQAAIEREKRDPLSSAGSTSDAEVQRIVAEVRAQGFGMHDKGTEGFTGIAAPIFDHAGELSGALTVTGPTHQHQSGVGDPVVESLLQAAGEVSAALGYRTE